MFWKKVFKKFANYEIAKYEFLIHDLGTFSLQSEKKATKKGRGSRPCTLEIILFTF
jgi:hypothetical protein